MSEPAQRFVWPPARESKPSPVVDAEQNLTGAVGEAAGRFPRVRAAILEFERVWLDMDTEPLPERMRAANWSPDPVHAYCRRCGSTASPHETDDTGCAECRGRKLPWERIVRLGAFEGLLRDMVLEVKFTRWRRLGTDLGRMLGTALRPVFEAEAMELRKTVLVPVPTSLRRRLSRGIDHAAVIARGAGEELGCRVVSGLSRRHGPMQSRLNAKERVSSVAGSITARHGLDLRGWNVVIVDDVTTTRATLKAATKALLPSCKSLDGKEESRVWGAVLGVTPKGRVG